MAPAREGRCHFTTIGCISTKTIIPASLRHSKSMRGLLLSSSIIYFTHTDSYAYIARINVIVP